MAVLADVVLLVVCRLEAQLVVVATVVLESLLVLVVPALVASSSEHSCLGFDIRHSMAVLRVLDWDLDLFCSYYRSVDDLDRL